MRFRSLSTSIPSMALALACAGAREQPADAVRAEAPAPTAAPEPPPEPPTGALPPVDAGAPDTGTGTVVSTVRGDGRVELDPDFPDGTRSLRVRGLSHVMREPRDRARYIGKITPGTRVAFRRVVAPDPEPKTKRRRKRRHCEAWVEIVPRGFVCQSFLVPSEEPPEGTVQPVLKGGALTPHAYFKVRANDTPAYATEEDIASETPERTLSTKVMLIGNRTVDVDGVSYRKTDHGLVEASALYRLWPSKFEGRRLDDPASVTWPFGWVVFEKWAAAPWLRRAPNRDAERVRRAERREVVTVFEERDGYLRVGDAEWIERRWVRLAVLRSPPPGTDDGQWVDVDLDEQVLVAYEGRVPVFATLVSTGASRHPTPAATFRVRAKAATTPMAGDPDAKNRYEVSGVPWAVRFRDGLYIHGAYWHDGFGNTRSHGCVNVSPKDAAHLYEWVGPEAPPGWSEVEVPAGQGALVRIHDEQHREPREFDYREEEPWNYPAPEESTEPAIR